MTSIIKVIYLLILDTNKFEEDALDPKTYITRDHLRLIVYTYLIQGKSFEEKLSASYAFAQSVKLGYFESDIDNSISEARTLAEELEKNGVVNVDHIELNKKVIVK